MENGMDVISKAPATGPDPALFAAVEAAWPGLPAAIQQAIAALVVHSADQNGQPARRTRHRQYSASEIATLRAKTAAVVAEHPTLPHRMIADRVGLGLSTYKLLRLNKTANACLAMSTAPASASHGYDGERAVDQDENEGEE